jgi:phytoene dehydrogenase-like protein
VSLSGGETLDAKLVAASCNPRAVFLDMLAPTATTYKLQEHIGNFRSRGTTARLLLAVEGQVSVAGHDGVRFARTGAHLDDIERAFDAVKYRELSKRPVLDIAVPSVETADLAPAGNSVIDIEVHFAPYQLEGGWTDEARQTLQSRALDELTRHAPDLAARIVGSELLSPPDLEARYGLIGGSTPHGELALDQLLVRPVPDCVGYETPVPGLFLCGSGSHPGSYAPCAAGVLAAERISR